jgi:hypothetical protein
MTYLRGLLLSAVVAASLTIPSPSFSDVKIVLKNGNEMTADNCQERASSYVCYITGGSFELDKGDVKTIRNVTSRAKGIQPEPAAEEKADENQPVPPKTEGDAKQGSELSAKDAASKVIGSEAEKRLEQINRRKKELSAEREQLLKDREQLQEDLKKAPAMLPQGRFEELKKRNAELDMKINMFNEEVGRLNEEENLILKKAK